MYEVTITSDAYTDLLRLVDRLTAEVSEDYALKTENAILDAIDGLENMPERYLPLPETVELVGTYFRRVIAEKYKVIFTIEHDQREVFVVRILHIKRNTKFILRALSK